MRRGVPWHRGCDVGYGRSRGNPPESHGACGALTGIYPTASPSIHPSLFSDLTPPFLPALECQFSAQPTHESSLCRRTSYSLGRLSSSPTPPATVGGAAPPLALERHARWAGLQRHRHQQMQRRDHGGSKAARRVGHGARDQWRSRCPATWPWPPDKHQRLRPRRVHQRRLRVLHKRRRP